MQTHTIVVTLQTDGDLTLEEIATITGNLNEHIRNERAAVISGFAKITGIDVSLTGDDPPARPTPAA